MKLPSPYRCDYCDKLKGESNHWWLSLAPDSIGALGGTVGFVMVPWGEMAALEPNVEHICGQECAAKALAKWMADQF
jgi:hypothetical protein